MKFLMRMAGTWLLGLSMVLVVIDGTKVLASGSWTTTSLSALWATLDPTGWQMFSGGVAGWPAPVAQFALALSTSPGWAVMGFAALLLLLAGRPRERRMYAEVY